LNLDSQDFWIGWILIKIIREGFFSTVGRQWQEVKENTTFNYDDHPWLYLPAITGYRGSIKD